VLAVVANDILYHGRRRWDDVPDRRLEIYVSVGKTSSADVL